MFFTFDSAASRDYSHLLGLDVEVLPPVHTGGDIRQRTGDESKQLVIGFLGLQRPEKGYHLLPDVLRRLLRKDLPARFLVHNGDIHETTVGSELRELASADKRVQFYQRPADQSYWNKLLDGTDIVVLPYEPIRYAASYSAVAVEAVSCGLPMVCPKGTTMQTIAARYQENYGGIEDWTANAIVDATVEAVAGFQQLSQSAYEGAKRWAMENGASAFVPRLLEFAKACGPMQPSAAAYRYDPRIRGLAYIARAKMSFKEWRSRNFRSKPKA